MKNKSADVIWRGFDGNCVCPLIDHGQQPMKMHTEVTLLYKRPYLYFVDLWGLIHIKHTIPFP